MAEKGTGPPYQMRTANSVAEDNLDLANYREAFRLIITTAPTPATVGLYGEWGTGKTSFMQQVRAELSGVADGWDGDGCPTVWFDLWEHERNPAPMVAMLNVARAAALAELDRRLDDAARGKGALRKSWQELKTRLQKHEHTLINAGRAFVRSVVGAPGVTVALGESSLGVANPFASVAEYFNEFQTQQLRVIDDQTRLRDKLALVVDDLVKVAQSSKDDDTEPGPVVFFIDDLDRCPPCVMVELLEQIRLFLCSPGCVFVIGMDDGVLVQSVITQRPELVGAHGTSGREPSDDEKDAQERAARRYLEKMVQYPFMLPRLGQTKIEDFTKTVLAQVGFRDTEADAVNAVVPGILHERRDQLSLRFVVRLANALVLNHLLTKDKIEAYDLQVTALLTVLQHAYNIEYKHALAAPDGAADLWRRLTAPVPESQEDWELPVEEASWAPEPWMTRPNATQLRTRAREFAPHVTPERFAEYVELTGAAAQVVTPLEPELPGPGSSESWFGIPGEGVTAEVIDTVVQEIRSHRIRPGQTVTVGRFSWVLLDVDDGHRQAVLLAEDVLGRQRYHKEHGPTSWARCSLREILNTTEFPSLLGPAWWSRLVERECPNENNPWSGASGGGSTRDRVFLLSIDEYRRFREVIPMPDAWWWLRSPGRTAGRAAYVIAGGGVRGTGDAVTARSVGVRPALSLSLEF